MPGENNILNSVRSSCRMVAEQTVFVRINHKRLGSYISGLSLPENRFPELDPARHFLGQGNETVAYFLTLDTINFGSGYFPDIRKRNGMSGYFTVASYLNDYFMNYGALSAEQLAQITPEICIGIFHQNPACRASMELMRLFAEALNELGKYLISNFNGSFREFVDAAGFSAERLVRLLIRMPYFNDSSLYLGKKVMFYKRAQIAAADLFLSFKSQGPGRFDDIDELTIFADNLVPHVLRLDGILEYDDALLSRIEDGKEIPQGSREEIEIRACAVHAVELMVEELKRGGKRINSMLVDQYLWNRGQMPEFRNRPRHRTRTVYY